MPNFVRCLISVLSVFLFCIASATAQIVEFREVDGKTIQCLHSGLMSDLKDCGVRSDWYAYAFVGSISAITPIDKDEKQIRVIPEEVFHGEPANPLVLQTSQGACLQEMAVGDRWLFFLRNGNPIVLDYYGDASRPVDRAQQQIETLRRLKTVGDLGILRGSVERGPRFFDGEAVPNAHVLAARASDHALFSAITDDKGQFEFEPLTPGRYKLSVDPIGSFQPDEANVNLRSGSCWDVALSRSPHAQISGRVKHSDGSPVPKVAVIIIYEDGSGFNTITSDAHGYFHSDGMVPGKYVVGINLPGSPAWKVASCGGACETPLASLYYGGMHSRSDALVIALAEDEQRKDIDFVVPVQ
jgi:hypothetical protein